MKDKPYIHARTWVYNINYHLVWCVKYRRKALSDEISHRLYELIHEIADEKGFSIIECNVGEQDHVHCFVSAPPKLSVLLTKRQSAVIFKNNRLAKDKKGGLSYG